MDHDVISTGIDTENRESDPTKLPRCFCEISLGQTMVS